MIGIKLQIFVRPHGFVELRGLPDNFLNLSKKTEKERYGYGSREEEKINNK